GGTFRRREVRYDLDAFTRRAIDDSHALGRRTGAELRFGDVQLPCAHHGLRRLRLRPGPEREHEGSDDEPESAAAQPIAHICLLCITTVCRGLDISSSSICQYLNTDDV